ncbi:S8/S53 family peptidase [Micromonospora carbonacea]|uniref:Subtilase family protein n=1 Tax=Micromonospora carbonacea TaxID=47853 RepID=A0A1C4Y7Q4_9ACTN|nr:S8/S53 family peptidase [Micromonospora carbonacea]SCF16758.1 Subtilase family protein [Micromonospora carbonacea]
MTPTPPVRRPTAGRRRILATVVAAALAAGIVTTIGPVAVAAPTAAGPTAPGSAVPTASTPAGTRGEPLAVRIDPGLSAPRLPIDPVGRFGTDRELGVVAGPDGSPAGLVLDEVMVRVADQAELDAFLTRWGGQVLDSFALDEQGQDHLVRVDADRADPAGLVDDLRAAEPGQSGTYRVGDERALRLLALAAAEWRAGTELVLDWVVEPTGIVDGEVYEAPDITNNVFDWMFMKYGGAMDIGVAPAWQLLAAKGKLTKQVKYLVQDGGFQSNPDFPTKVSLHSVEWGKTNTNDCTGGNPCPWHATDVVLAAMGRVDNGYGTAGPAGPVVDELVAVRNGIDYWTVLRRLEKAAEASHPDVVNLSFTRDVNLGKSHASTWTDRRMKHVRDTGALIVSSAGNDAANIDGDTLYVPCESTHVMCVGGMKTDATLGNKSNFGTSDLTTSVEIYGPVCVMGLKDPGNPAVNETRSDACGTSVAAPFVGGVAALVMAADPSLTAAQVRDILNDTAHVGGLGAKVTGSQRRVDALAAVAKALGVKVDEPAVSIGAPTTGQHVGVGQSVDLWGKATDFLGKELPITWISSRDGVLGHESQTFVPALSPGTHVITAKATDGLGRTGSATVSVTVVDSPTTAAIISPPVGLTLAPGQSVSLVGTSHDPDAFGPVPDAEASWTVRRGGTVVHQQTGHLALLPAGKVTAGSYTATFTAGGATAQRSFTVTALLAGQHRPTATITKPATAQDLTAIDGKPKLVAFAGTAADVEDGTVAGTRYRWTAYGDGGVKKVLCQGSAVPTGGPVDDIVLPQSCAGFSAELGLGKGNVTTWSVWLEVFDSAGLVGVDSVPVRIQVATP